MSTHKPPSKWPLYLISASAFAAIWSGWVGLGQKVGFGVVKPLPGIWDDFTLNTAITLPLGMEAYAFYAMNVWLTGSAIKASTRAFAKWSSIGALFLGGLGQVAYHLLESLGLKTAPAPVVVLVSCLPVMVVGFGAGLTHALRRDLAAVKDVADGPGHADTDTGHAVTVTPAAPATDTDTGRVAKSAATARMSAPVTATVTPADTDNGHAVTATSSGHAATDKDMAAVTDTVTEDNAATDMTSGHGHAVTVTEDNAVTATAKAPHGGRRVTATATAKGLKLREARLALATDPDMDTDRLAEILGTSVRTARRYRNDVAAEMAAMATDMATTPTQDMAARD